MKKILLASSWAHFGRQAASGWMACGVFFEVQCYISQGKNRYHSAVSDAWLLVSLFTESCFCIHLQQIPANHAILTRGKKLLGTDLRVLQRAGCYMILLAFKYQKDQNGTTKIWGREETIVRRHSHCP